MGILSSKILIFLMAQLLLHPESDDSAQLSQVTSMQFLLKGTIKNYIVDKLIACLFLP
jgi:hypothetical protein